MFVFKSFTSFFSRLNGVWPAQFFVLLTVTIPLTVPPLLHATEKRDRPDEWSLPSPSFKHAKQEGQSEPSRSSFLQGESEKSFLIANPCIDGVFQHGFADPLILADFLNTVLDFQGEKMIVDIEYMPRELNIVDAVRSVGYHFTVDVRCRTQNNHHFIIEMQNDFRNDYHLKALIEHSRMLSQLDTDHVSKSEKIEKSAKKFWKDVEGIYTIVITNKLFGRTKLKKNHPKEPIMEPLLVNKYELRHTQDLTRHYGDIPNQLVLLMLSNLKEEPNADSPPIERWSYVLQDSSLRLGAGKIAGTKEIKDIDLLAGDNNSIRQFIKRIRNDTLPQEVKDTYIRALTYFNETIIDIRKKAIKQGRAEGLEEGEKIGVEKGRAKGLEEGERIGIEKERRKTIERMLREKLEPSLIAGILGISTEEINAIKDQMT